MTVHILGLGPITSELAREIDDKQEVKIYSNHNSGKFNCEVNTYESFLELPFSERDIFFLGWKDLPKDDLIRQEVFNYLSDKLEARNTVFNLSSVAVYGNNANPNNEFTDPCPVNSYGFEKLRLENLYDSSFDSKVCHLRISNVFGDFRFNDVINKFIHALLSGKALEIWGAASSSRDYISIQSVARKMSTCSTSLEKLGWRDTFNICSGVSISLEEITGMIQGILEKSINIDIKEKTDQIIDSSFISCDKFNLMFDQSHFDESGKLSNYLRIALLPLLLKDG